MQHYFKVSILCSRRYFIVLYVTNFRKKITFFLNGRKLSFTLVSSLFLFMIMVTLFQSGINYESYCK